MWGISFGCVIDDFDDTLPHVAPQEPVPIEGPVDAGAGAGAGADADAELSGLRIRQVTSLRRGAFKARSYCIIGAAACLVAAIQLVVMMIKLARFGGIKHWAMIGGEALLALGSLWGCAGLTRRAIAFHRELGKPMLQEPTTPPDFSTLSDGSQQVQALQQMQIEADTPPQTMLDE
jgi:hypothetical protein